MGCCLAASMKRTYSASLSLSLSVRSQCSLPSPSLCASPPNVASLALRSSRRVCYAPRSLYVPPMLPQCSLLVLLILFLCSPSSPLLSLSLPLSPSSPSSPSLSREFVLCVLSLPAGSPCRHAARSMRRRSADPAAGRRSPTPLASSVAKRATTRTGGGNGGGSIALLCFGALLCAPLHASVRSSYQGRRAAARSD